MAKINSNKIFAQLLYSATFLLLAILLPFLSSYVNVFGSSLCLMHLPVILCGLRCGSLWGMAVGIVSPLIRYFVFGAFGNFPEAFIVCVELAVSAFMMGMLYQKLDKNLFMVFVELVFSILCGKLVWCFLTLIAVFFDLTRGVISADYLWNTAVESKLAGILLQLVLIPGIYEIWKKNNQLLN